MALHDFTPGPWETASNKSGRQVIVHRFGLSVATAHGSSAEANARLIAAAPELLAALAGALPALERDTLTSSENAALQRARAAIAKAKGL